MIAVWYLVLITSTGHVDHIMQLDQAECINNASFMLSQHPLTLSAQCILGVR